MRVRVDLSVCQGHVVCHMSAPDVFDLGLNVALANKDLFAPYKVSTWDDIAAELKDADGAYYGDYGGFMSIGYDAAKVPAPTSVKDPSVLCDARSLAVPARTISPRGGKFSPLPPQLHVLRNQKVGSRWMTAASGPRLLTVKRASTSSGPALAYSTTTSK